MRPEIERVECDGEAILFASGLWARLPEDLPETLALAALDVCGAPALVGRHLRPGDRVLVLGAGKSGLLVAAHARSLLAGAGEVVAADRSEAALAAIARARARAIGRSRSTRRTRPPRSRRSRWRAGRSISS